MKLNDENEFEYIFKELPVISGKVIDYVICYFVVQIQIKAIEEDWDSVSIFQSILSNMFNK